MVEVDHFRFSIDYSIIVAGGGGMEALQPKRNYIKSGLGAKTNGNTGGTNGQGGQRQSQGSGGGVSGTVEAIIYHGKLSKWRTWRK